MSTLTRLDKSNVYGSAVDLAKQVGHAWKEAQQVVVPESYRSFNKIVMCGMGGSILGARLIESVFAEELAWPLILVNDYQLPGWVDKQTLVICSSYSGATEETLANFKQALAKQAKLMVITAGGELLAAASANHIPVYKIDPVFNPSKQPRMAIGYSVIGQLVLCHKAGLLNLTQVIIDGLVRVMDQVKPETAEAFAAKLENKQVILVAGEHLTGPAHTVKNQMNENAKHLSHRHDLPELNHHLMEGLRFPQSNPDSTMFWFVSSSLYSARLQQRLSLTREVVAKNKLASVTWEATAKTKLDQAFELIQFGAYVNFYLSQLHQIDPAPIPWVDYFKQRLRGLSS
ncbi:MAG: SIS domain-containing protein [Candidatus Beckwithbacteria bacterium]|nr:SIS domain-containing protein [Candidatus Beckwithbacteria bacterium]